MSRFALLLLFLLSSLFVMPEKAYAACHRIPIGPDSPTGIAGCEIYGYGLASTWSGPGIARNDCIWPWTACTTVVITSVETGQTITVTPTMFGDLYTGTPDQRIVDLDPVSVRRLGLDPGRGLWPVQVMPLGAVGDLPDTAFKR
jgi:hypothetical protein